MGLVVMILLMNNKAMIILMLMFVGQKIAICKHLLELIEQKRLTLTLSFQDVFQLMKLRKLMNLSKINKSWCYFGLCCPKDTI